MKDFRVPRDVVPGPFDRPLRILRLARPPESHGRPPGEPGKYRQLEDFIEVPVEWSYADPGDEDAIVSGLPGCDVYLGVIFKKKMTAAADSLKMIALHAAGYEKIDPESVPDGVVVVNAYEHEAPIAEWVMMAAEVLDHQVIEADHRLRKNDWGMWIFRRPPYRELMGRTMGVVGLGHIGRRVLKLARAYDMRLIAVSRTAPSAQDVDALGLAWAGSESDLDKLMADADFVVVSTPLLASTTGLIGKRQIDQMKPDAYIINPSRGPIIDETALYGALREGKIGGAALDVWWQYPDGPDDHTTRPSKYPFHELENVLMTPHISGGTYGTSERRSKVVAENINRLYRGEPLINVVPELTRLTRR